MTEIEYETTTELLDAGLATNEMFPIWVTLIGGEDMAAVTATMKAIAFE